MPKVVSARELPNGAGLAGRPPADPAASPAAESAWNPAAEAVWITRKRRAYSHNSQPWNFSPLISHLIYISSISHLYLDILKPCLSLVYTTYTLVHIARVHKVH